MDKYFLLMLGIGFPMLGYVVQLGKGPYNEDIENKFMIPKTSKIRKIIPFREDPTHPFIYLKILPFLASVIIAFAILLLYAIDFFIPSIITPVLIHPVTVMSFTVLGLLYMIYGGIMNAI